MVEVGGAKRQVVMLPPKAFVNKSADQSILGVLQFHTGVVAAVAQDGSVAQARPGTQAVQAVATYPSYLPQMASMATITLHPPRTLVA